MDDIDAVAPKRTIENPDCYPRETVIQILIGLDAVKLGQRPILLMAGTARPEDVDEAILCWLETRVELYDPQRRTDGDAAD